MTLFQDITIIDLLRQREAEFVVVWTCEQKIKDLLGDVDFPFPTPADLPSRRRRAARQAPTREKPPARPAAPPETAGPTVVPAGQGVFPPIRKLDAARENAYRLVFLRHGIKDSSFQTDCELINALAGLHCPEFRLLSLETVLFTDLDDWQVVDTLWEDSPEG